MLPSALRRRVLLSGTMLVTAVAGYGRRAYAACVNSGGSTYQCSGASGAQTINANNAAVSTLPGFSVTTGGSGITITGDGALSYTDTNASPLTAGGTALYMYSHGDFAGTPGSITINTNGAISATYGISGVNRGSGALSITTKGNVTGAIYATNYGTTLSVTTGAGTTVHGNSLNGIYALNHGTGALTITANGNVTAPGDTVFHNGSGIYAQNFGTALSVTTAAGTTVSGLYAGIHAYNFGTGALTITANGDVTATGSGAFLSAGINVENIGTALSVTTAAGTTVSGQYNGIRANNLGTGALTITVNGNVTGTSQDGIVASSSRPIAITVGATGTVTSNGVTASAFAIETKNTTATVTVAGTVNGGAGGAIKFDPGVFANRLELVTGAVINGNVLGGSGTDTLGLSGTGSGSFNVAKLSSFEAGQKTESGTWTLTGANTAITNFSVGGGTLFVNGSLSNAAFTVNGGTLGGTGTVGSTSIASNGIFAPGNGTPGTSMTVSGSLTFAAAATYLVQVNPATASFATSTGAATLGGATVSAVFASGSYTSKQYTILTAGSISGAFGSLNTNLPSGFKTSLSYDATHAYLNLALGFAPGLSGNQQAVGNALINFFNTTGGIPLPFGALTPAGLTQLSGEGATATQQTTFNAMGQFMGLMTDPFVAGRGDGASAGGTPTAYAEANSADAGRGRTARERDAYAAIYAKAPQAAAFAQRWSVWAAGYGGSQTTRGDPVVLGSNDTRSSLYGTAVGADYRFTPDTIAGFALAGGGTSFNVNALGSGRSDLFQAGAFVRHNEGPAYVTAALAYGWQDVTTNRTLAIAGIDQLRAEFNANAYSGRVEGGYRFVAPVLGGVGVTPYAAGQFTTFDLPSYMEQATVGSNQFALAYGSKNVTDTRSELGIRTDKSFAAQNGIFTLRSRLAWAHDFDRDRSIGATFQTLPGASFVVNGATQAADSVLTTASVEWKWLNGWSAAATFEGEFSDVTSSYAGKGVVRYAW